MRLVSISVVAVGLGLAIGGCASTPAPTVAHVPASAPAPASASASAPASAPAPASSSPRPLDPAEDAAMRIGNAWIACDKPTALALSLSYDEVVTFTKKDVDRKEWERDTRDFTDQRCREFAEAHVHLLTAKVVRTEHHGASEDPDRLKTDVDVSFVQFVVEKNGEASLHGELPFIRTDHGFKFMAKH